MEYITVNFNQPQRGIYRMLPLYNEVMREDGSSSQNRAKISNIEVNEKYSVKNENGYKKITIGDPNLTQVGTKDYVIKYRYNLGKDPLEGMDELYFNLLGTEWDAKEIKDVTFFIEMPKTFDSSTLGFSAGYQGVNLDIPIEWNVQGNQIQGRVLEPLTSNQGVTVRMSLPEDYFNGESNNYFDLYFFGGCFLFAIIIVTGLTLKKTKPTEKTVVESVEFYPPGDYNPAELAFLNEDLTNKSIISLLIYLAHKGYLKIEDIEGGKGFRIIKLKEYDGKNSIESTFFHGLFEGPKGSFYEKQVGEGTFSRPIKKEYVTDKTLYDSFYRTIKKIWLNLHTSANKKKMYGKTNWKNEKWIWIMVAIVSIFIVIKPVLQLGMEISGEKEFFIIFLPTISFAVMFETIFQKYHKKIRIPLFLLGAGIGALTYVALRNMFTIYTDEILYWLGIITIGFLFSCFPPRRAKTDFAIEIQGKIRGFKKFLETAEKPQLELLVEQNPEYYYQILPYAYALGVSDVWIKKFEVIAQKEEKNKDLNEDHKDYDPYENRRYDDEIMMEAAKNMSENVKINYDELLNSVAQNKFGRTGGGIAGRGSGGGGGGVW